MRIIFMGTPDFAVTALHGILAAQYNVVAVYCQPPRPAGRKMQLQQSPVQVLAQSHDIPVFMPNNFKSAVDIEAFARLQPDLVIVAAYGLILPKVILDMPKFGCINIHGSLLPRWRGAAPIHRAILAGDKETGITIMQMDVGLDTGDMLAQAKIPLSPDSTTQVVHDELAALGAELIIPVIKQVEAGELNPIVQPEAGVCYAHKLVKEEGLITWDIAAIDIERKLRALNPWPGTWFMVHGKRVKLLNAEVIDSEIDVLPGVVLDAAPTIKCARGCIRLLTVQPEGKKVMSAQDFFNGYQIIIGAQLV